MIPVNVAMTTTNMIFVNVFFVPIMQQIAYIFIVNLYRIGTFLYKNDDSLKQA